MLKRASDWTYTGSHLRCLRAHKCATYATLCAHMPTQGSLQALQVFSTLAAHALYSACSNKLFQVFFSAVASIRFTHIGEDLYSLALVEERIADLIALKLALLFKPECNKQRDTSN